MIEPTGQDEDEVRRYVILAGRVLERAGQGDMVWGHVSFRDVAGRGVWMKAAKLGFDEVTEDDVLLISWTGEKLIGRGAPHIEYPIHTQVMRRRPDVRGVVHTHPLHAIAFAATGWSLKPVSHEGSQFVPPDIARFTGSTDIINSEALGEELAESIGERNAVLLPCHGIVTVGADLGTAVGAAIHLERACQIQLLAGPDSIGASDDQSLAKRGRASRRFSAAWEYLSRNETRYGSSGEK